MISDGHLSRLCTELPAHSHCREDDLTFSKSGLCGYEVSWAPDCSAVTTGHRILAAEIRDLASRFGSRFLNVDRSWVCGGPPGSWEEMGYIQERNVRLTRNGVRFQVLWALLNHAPPIPIERRREIYRRECQDRGLTETWEDVETIYRDGRRCGHRIWVRPLPSTSAA